MRLSMYSVFDSVANVYGTPFFSQSDAVAKRSFRMLCEDPQSTVSRSLTDYSLYAIGMFDDENAQISPNPAITLVCRAADFMKRSDV